VLNVTILVDDDHVGAVMSDLSSKGGRVMGTELVPGISESAAGRTLIHAEVPETELVRYASELRSLSHGTGTFSRKYLRHEPVPAAKAAQLSAG
jgi:elongation factor G